MLAAIQRINDRKTFTLAVFRTIRCGHGFLGTKCWPSYRCWEPRAREDLTDPTMLAQRRDRHRRPSAQHGPIVNGTPQPIQKAFDWIRRRWLTNERY